MDLLAIAFTTWLSSYDSASFDTEWAYSAALGDPLYIVVSHEDPDLNILGQPMGGLDMMSYGIGGRVPINDKFFVRGDISYYEPDVDPHPNVEHEVVYVNLRNHFGEQPFQPTNLEYTLDDGWGFTLGAGYQLTKRFSVEGAYRWLSLEERYEMWDERIGRHEIGVEPDCGCWWVMTENKSVDAAQIKFTYTLGRNP